MKIWDMWYSLHKNKDRVSEPTINLVHEGTHISIRAVYVRGMWFYTLSILESGRASRVPGYVSSDFADFREQTMQLIAQATPVLTVP